MPLPESIMNLVKDLPQGHPALNARAANGPAAQQAKALTEFLRGKREVASALPLRSFNRVQSNLSLLMMSRDALAISLMADVFGPEDSAKVKSTVVEITKGLRAYAEFHDHIYSGNVQGRGVAKFADDFETITDQAVDAAVWSLAAVLVQSDHQAEQSADMIMHKLADQSKVE